MCGWRRQTIVVAPFESKYGVFVEKINDVNQMTVVTLVRQKPECICTMYLSLLFNIVNHPQCSKAFRQSRVHGNLRLVLQAPVWMRDTP